MTSQNLEPLPSPVAPRRRLWPLIGRGILVLGATVVALITGLALLAEWLLNNEPDNPGPPGLGDPVTWVMSPPGAVLAAALLITWISVARPRWRRWTIRWAAAVLGICAALWITAVTLAIVQG